jgi:prepilin-type N-terminal cleavage/methylation domain-containing protein
VKARSKTLRVFLDMNDRKKRSNCGFTLLELLISLTIFGLIVGVIFNSFRISVRAWEKGDSEVERQQRSRVAFDLLRHQLASAYVTEPRRDGQKSFLFNGTSKSLEFISTTRISPGNQRGLIHVQYSVKPKSGEKEESLICDEQEAVFMNNESSPGEGPEETKFELISEVPAIEFAFLSEAPRGMALQWVNAWDLETSKQYPKAVKLTVTEEPETSPVVLIIPVGSAGFERRANESQAQK